MRRDDEAPHTSAGGSKGRGGPVVKGTAHRTPSPDSVSEDERAARAATIHELAAYLDPRAFDLSEALFTCPLCSVRSAEIRSDVAWTCAPCRTYSTIHELRRLVLERPAPLARLRAGGTA
jgi:hypothetical protein